MTIDHEPDLNEVGRQIQLLPVPPGFWSIVMGAGAMTLGPLFGFLIGTMIGTEPELAGMNAIFLSLFVGFIVAGVGLGAVLLGVRTVLAHRDPV